MRISRDQIFVGVARAFRAIPGFWKDFGNRGSLVTYPSSKRFSAVEGREEKCGGKQSVQKMH
jgi:hypothetical protein